MHHSDRGSQYWSKANLALQTSYKMQTSTSNKGDCWDAPTESLWGSLKVKSEDCMADVLQPDVKRWMK